MIGNDIVDLVQSSRESNWRRKGWLAKTLTLHEQRLVAGAEDPDAMIWLLWSMKEAAYKIVNRETGRHFLAPLQLECHLLAYDALSASGFVCYEDKKYNTRTLSCPDFHHTVSYAATEAPPVLQAEIRRLMVASRMGRRNTFLKEAGFPLVEDRRSGKRSMASRSHHGRFDAVVFIA